MRARHKRARPGLRGPVLAGSAALALFVSAFVGWGLFAPLESAAIAQGAVTVDGRRRVLRHLEGGIVERILVKDGDRVRAGQPLIRLDQTQSLATLTLLRVRRLRALADLARLRAARASARRIAFPRALKAEGGSVGAQLVGEAERLLAARRRAHDDKVAVLAQRIRQHQREMAGLRGQIAANSRQIRLIAAEIADVGLLTAKGLARRPRLLALKRREAELTGRLELDRARLLLARESVTEARLKIAETESGRQSEIAAELAAAAAHLREINEQIAAAADIHRRTVIRAPLAGTVTDMKVNTPGAAIEPRAALLAIVPAGSLEFVEAFIEPGDIDVVRAGQTVRVRLTPFSRRRTLPLAGRLVTVSADRISEGPRRGYYLARVALAHAREAALPLYPGMPAEVMIVTGKRSAFTYLFAPLTRSFARAFRQE
jgi:HlyD family secretion protein